MFWTISQDQSLFASFKKSWRLFPSQFVLWYYWMMDCGKHKCALLNGSYVLWKSSLWSWSFSIVFLWLFVKFSVWTLRNLEQSNRSLLGYRGRSFCQTLSDEELKPLSWSHQIHQTEKNCHVTSQNKQPVSFLLPPSLTFIHSQSHQHVKAAL